MCVIFSYGGTKFYGVIFIVCEISMCNILKLGERLCLEKTNGMEMGGMLE